MDRRPEKTRARTVLCNEKKAPKNELYGRLNARVAKHSKPRKKRERARAKTRARMSSNAPTPDPASAMQNCHSQRGPAQTPLAQKQCHAKSPVTAKKRCGCQGSNPRPCPQGVSLTALASLNHDCFSYRLHPQPYLIRQGKIPSN